MLCIACLFFFFCWLVFLCVKVYRHCQTDNNNSPAQFLFDSIEKSPFFLFGSRERDISTLSCKIYWPTFNIFSTGLFVFASEPYPYYIFIILISNNKNSKLKFSMEDYTHLSLSVCIPTSDENIVSVKN